VDTGFVGGRKDGADICKVVPRNISDERVSIGYFTHLMEDVETGIAAEYIEG